MIPGFVKDSETSREAAVSMISSAATLREKAYDYIVSKGADGATSDEVQAALQLTHQTGSARVTELKNAGRIVATGQKRKTRQRRNAMVYVADEF